jgi:YfiH family protein
VDAPQWLDVDWPAPPNVRAISTLRTGGVSVGPFASLNLGTHVGDEPAAVEENRRRLKTALHLDTEPLWLNQVHGVHVVAADARMDSPPPTADASVCKGHGRACVIMTADCLPVLFCNREGTRVGAAHAGWRGLASGVLGATVNTLGVAAEQLMAWLGPAIEQSAFEVGPEVREEFVTRNAAAATAFAANARGRWQADLYALARLELARLGVREVYGGTYRCHEDAARFFSYRRDGGKTGRMASLVWLT